MAFWGVEVKPGKPATHYCEKAGGRLRISQATLGIGGAAKKTIVQCNVGNKSPVLLCALLPNKTESCHLDLEFEEADDVIFSVIGPRSVFLTGYYVRQSHQSNPHSDTESYGVDIENTQTEGSSYSSDEDKYEDSFIDDDNDNDALQGSPESPVLSGKGLDGVTLENDKPRNRKGRGKQLKKEYQVSESENDAKSHENQDGDGYTLSAFNSQIAAEEAESDAAEKIAQVLVELGNDAKDNGVCDVESKQKADPLNISGKLGRVTKLPLDEEGTKGLNEKNELPREMETLEETLTPNEDHNKPADTIIDQNLPMSNVKDQIQSPDRSKPKRKRKSCSMEEEKTCEVQIDKDDSVLREDKENEVVASANPETAKNDMVDPLELDSVNGQKSKKRRNELQLEETINEEVGQKRHDIPKDVKLKEDLPHADRAMKDLPASNGEYREQSNASIKSELVTNDGQTEKKIKKKMKKTKGRRNLDVGVTKLTDNQETTLVKHDQNIDAVPIHQRTLSNGMIIEELASGPADGKVAAPGKKVKVYYTGMLKESGLVFDSNMDKTAFKFRLGDEEFIDGWNVGIDGMRVGDKRRLIIPPSMGFGDHGEGENVPPNSWLVYDIELVGVHK